MGKWRVESPPVMPFTPACVFNRWLERILALGNFLE